MAIANPFTMTIYDREMRPQGRIGNPMSCNFTPRFRAQGSGQVYLKATDPVLQKLLEPGARVGVEYRGEHLMSGPVRNPEGPFIAPNGQVLINIQDDWRRLVNTYAWNVPNAPLAPLALDANGQTTRPAGGPVVEGTTDGQVGYYLWPDGSAAAGGVSVDTSEAAVKHLIEVNLGRLPFTPLDVRPDLGRGGNPRAAGVLPNIRFLRLSEAIMPILEWSGLGVKVWQAPGTTEYSVDVWEPRSWSQPISAESGIVRDGRWSLQSPEATRAVVGGPGELAARAFWDGGVDDDLEALYGDVIEVFTDATGATLTWPDGLSEALKVAKYYLLRPEVADNDKSRFRGYLSGAGAQAREKAAPTSGLSLNLSETDAFHFGGPDGYHIGDQVTAGSAGLTFSDRISECTLSLNSSDGLKVTPVVGEKKNEPNRQVARAIVGLATALRQSNASK